jgi:hypothetical protein
VAAWLDGLAVEVIGLNCSVGPQGILEGIERMVHVTRRKLSAQPNAGMHATSAGRAMYMASAEYMATYARHLVARRREDRRRLLRHARPSTSAPSPTACGRSRRGSAATNAVHRHGPASRRPGEAPSPGRGAGVESR